MAISPLSQAAETGRANARLIAAAPALLEALAECGLQIEYLHDKFGGTGSGEAVLARARAVIAKATGQPSDGSS